MKNTFINDFPSIKFGDPRNFGTENLSFSPIINPVNIGFDNIKFGDPIHTDNFTVGAPPITFTPIVKPITVQKPVGTIKPIFVKQQAVRKVTSQVVDTYGETLPGASVHPINNTSAGVTTDFDGIFFIDVKDTDVLEVRYLGFEPVQIPVSQLTNKIVLKESNEVLDEIVVRTKLNKPKDNTVLYVAGALGVLALTYVLLSDSDSKPVKAKRKPSTVKKTTRKNKGLKGVAHVTI